MSAKGKVLVTGGAGYIGSSVSNALKDHGWLPIILDNLSSGPRSFTSDHIFYEGDVADRALLQSIYRDHADIFAVIHCAAKIIVPESVAKPDLYYEENVVKSLALFSSLRDLGCKRIVFSSSAAVYDVVDGFMVKEDSPLKPSSPYARSKYMMECILQDLCAAYDMSGIALRYFNPIGADPKMRTGSYVAEPTHVLGRMVASSADPKNTFNITGTSWPTRDGTGIRDYIHVWDLAKAHVAAVENFDKALSKPQPFGVTHRNFRIINLGTGNGVTVRELVTAFEKVSGKILNKVETTARDGDVAGSFANADTAKKLIGWSTELDVSKGIESALTWSQKYFKQ